MMMIIIIIIIIVNMFSGMASMEAVSWKKVHLTALPFIPLVLDQDFGRWD